MNSLLKNLSNFKLINLILIFFNTLLVGVIIYAIDKGIDFSDESFYFLFTNPKQEFSNFIINYDVIFKSIYSLFKIEFGISHLRLLRLLGTIFGISFFGFILKKYYFKDEISSLFYYNILILFSLSSYCLFPHTLSYNTINFITSFFLLGSVIILINKPKFYLATFVIAGCLYVSFLTKISTFFLYVLLFYTLFFYQLIFYRKYSFNFLLIHCFFAIIYFSTKFHFSNMTFVRLFASISQFQNNYYSPLNQILNLNRDLIVLIYPFLIGIIVKMVQQKLKLNSLLSILLIVLVILHLFVFDLHTQKITFRLSVSVFFLLGYNVDSVLKINNEKRFILFLIFIFPFILYYGSSNYVGLNIQIYLAYFLILSLFIVSKTRENILIYFVIFIFFLKGFYNNNISKPYRQKNLQLQTEKVQIGDHRHFVDKISKNRIEKIRSFYKMAPSNPMYALPMFQNIGDVILTGKIIPFSPFWDSNQFAIWKDNCKAFPNEFFAISYDNFTTYVTDFKKMNYEILHLGSFPCTDDFGENRILSCYYLSLKSSQ